MVAEITEYLEKPDYFGKLIKIIRLQIKMKDSIEEEIMNYINARMRVEWMVRVAKFHVVVKDGMHTVCEWNCTPVYIQFDIA